MEITQFTIQIVLIGTPGILCYFVTSKLIGRIGKNTMEAFLVIVLFSIASYVLFDLSFAVSGFVFGRIIPHDLVRRLFGNEKNIDAADIFGGVVSSIVLAFAVSYLYKFNWLNRIGRSVGATFRYGDEDLWHYFHRTPDTFKNGGWIFVRDHKYGHVYYGNVSVWSESEAKRELVLSNVTVYDNDGGKELYSVDHVYLCRGAEEISLEVPTALAQNQEKYERADENLPRRERKTRRFK